jgi:putative ABC transport system permease protein
LPRVAAPLASIYRELRCAPAFYALCAAVQGLGIAGAIVLFALEAGVRQSQPAGLDAPPESLAQLRHVVPMPFLRHNSGTFSFAEYQLLRRTSGFVEAAAVLPGLPIRVRVGGAEDNVRVSLVSRPYLEVLGVQPIEGRGFTAEEDREGRSYVCLLSERLVHRWAIDTPVVGTTLILNDQPTTVVGVLPRVFEGTNYTDRADLWLPIAQHAQVFPDGKLLDPDPRRHPFMVVARLRNGVRRSQAAREARAFFEHRESRSGRGESGATVALDPLLAYNHIERWQLTPYYGILGLAAALVLAMTLLNSAGLGFVRAVRRQRDTAIRLSLGASPKSIVRQRLLEAIALSAAGAVCGVAAAAILFRVLGKAAAAPMLERLLATAATTSWKTGAFVVALSIGTAVAAAAFPAWLAGRADPMLALRGADWSRRAARGPRARLLIGQLAVATTLSLLAAAALRSVWIGQGASAGFDARGLSLLRIDLATTDRDKPRALALAQGLLQRMDGDPAIQGATLSRRYPIEPSTVSNIAAVLQPDGRDALPVGSVPYDEVAPNYFDVMGIRLVAGRGFRSSAAGCADGPSEAVVNESAARSWPWRGPQPLGRLVRFGAEGRLLTVVGVAADVKFRGALSPSAPFLYLPLLESCAPSVMDLFGLTLAVRSRGPVDASGLRAAVEAASPKATIDGPRSIASLTSERLRFEKMLGWIHSAFGGLVLILCGVGFYAAASQLCAEREREFGVRMALGARSVDIAYVLLRWCVPTVGLGVPVGLLLGAGFALAVSSTTAVVLTVDWVVTLAAAGVVAATTLAAIGAPMRRVMGVQAATVLRQAPETF